MSRTDGRARHPGRREVLAGGAGLLGAATLPIRAGAAPVSPGETPTQGETESHGLSSFGELRYGADFPHFDYVRPDAPRGGLFSNQLTSTTGNQNFETFDTLHIFVLKGNGAAGMGACFDSLMTRALDEPDGMYGLLARSVRWTPDRLTYRFRLRPEARFSDGSRVSAGDVAWSIATLKEKGHPAISQSLGALRAAEAEGDDVVRIELAPERARDLILLIAGLPVFSRAWWSGRDFEASTLDAPLGSGPYRVDRFETGRFITFARVPDYWGAGLPVNVGQNNFDGIRFEYFRDRTVAFEAFKAGAFAFREEFTARVWATGYDFPAATDGRVKRETLPDKTPPGAQGWFFNLRRPVFADPRVREAISLAFDFEWTNRTVMYGAYARTVSFFENAPGKADGPPGPGELALLEPWRGRVPDEVFGAPYVPPTTDGSGQNRPLLRRASELLEAAGCKRVGSEMRLPSGEPLSFEFLDSNPALQPHTQPFVRNLGLLGINATIRLVDASQYQRRQEDFDFDVTVRRYGGSTTPGEGLRRVFGSTAAATRGSPNIAGFSDPAIDAMLDAIANADSRDALDTACRALDRVLRAGRYWVPMWYRDNHPLAYWDTFGHPAETPAYGVGAPDTWWWDADKAKRIGRT